MTMPTITSARDRRRMPLLVLAALLTLAGCDDVLDVEDPDVATPEQFTDPSALPAIRTGVIGDFSVAYDDQILYSGLLGDEWVHSGTFPTRAEVDIRHIENDNATLEGVTRELYRARSAAEFAIEDFEALQPNTAGHAEVTNLAAYTYLMFAENYCSGVPFSTLTEGGELVFGDRETTQQILERALERGTLALQIAQAAGSASQANLARIAQGRALLNLARYAEAAAAVSGVPTDFVYVIEHSDNTDRENNGVFIFDIIVERWAVANLEGGNGLPYRDNFSAGDPRTPWRRSAGDVGFDRVTPEFDQLLYDSRSAPTPLAVGVEARLIEAEAALQAGNTTLFLGTLNDLRAGADIPAAVDPGTQAGRVDLLFRERAFWLWLTSHRLGDMRRLIRAYGRTEDQVFPIGDYHKNLQGGVYGDDVNLPLTVDERNNPNLVEGNLCLDRNA